MADVNQRMFQVIQGFSNLDYEERVEVFKAIKQYQDDVDTEKRKGLILEFSKKAGVPLGPTGQGSCPCCGK